MKRAMILLISLTLLLAGCSAAPTTPPTGAANATATPAAEDQGFVFTVKGTTIAMHAEAAPILAALGTPKEYFEAESCAFQGMERSYVFSGFKVTTYELDKVDHVASVLILDDSVATPEGVFMNATLAEVVKAYGDKYEQNLGLYKYASAKMTLSFLIEDDHVTSIEYVALAS